MKVFTYRLFIFSFGCLFLLTCVATAQDRDKNQYAGQTLFPSQLASDVALFNPSSGLYSSINQNQKKLNFLPPNPQYTDFAPLPAMPVNTYGRLSWHSLEPSEGNYNFDAIESALQSCSTKGHLTCLPQGAKFGFRVMALNPQTNSDTNVTTGDDNYPVYSDVPAYLETGQHGWLLPVNPQDKTLGHYFIPDWNDPFVLGRMAALLSALGQRYDHDKRIGWIDIGLYGSWGEWHTSGLPDAIDYTHGIPYDSSAPYYNLNIEAYTQNHHNKSGAYQTGTIASKDFIVSEYAKAFPSTQLLMLTDDGEALCHALQMNMQVPVGMRRDSLGSSNGWSYQFPDKLPGCDSQADINMILTRWQTAPFVTEAYGNGSSPKFPCQSFETDPLTGAYNLNEQVPQYHVAAIKNASFCTGTWSQLSTSEQQSVLTANLQSGYRFAPIKIYTPLPSSEASPVWPTRRVFSITTSWSNTGVTPAYNNWQVEFSFWTPPKSDLPQEEIRKFNSRVDLRKILPTGDVPILFEDNFDMDSDLLPYTGPDALLPGLYELRVRVVDPAGYMNPMQLALKNVNQEHYYPLGFINIPL